MDLRNAPGSSRRLLLVAAAALFDAAGRVLITQRPPHKQMGGFWEFPGGKVEEGEAPEAALVRELKEELALTVAPSALEPFAFASHAYPDFHLLMPLYVATKFAGEMQLDASAAIDARWVAPGELKSYAMPPADVVLVERLLQRGRA